GGGFVRGKLEKMFAYRHAVTASDLRRHGRFCDRPRLTVAVTGSTGLVGSDLVPFLTTGGHTVVRLVRKPRPTEPDDGTTARIWNPDAPDPAIFDGIDAVIHLAGENVAEGRWNAAKKARIRDSRVGPTRRLAEEAAKAGVKRFVAASAIGFYGDRGDEELDETSPRGTGFFPDTCEAWDADTRAATAAGVRVANVRVGVVLTPKGGALGKQLPAFRAGGGAVLGAGTQWIPWVTAHDLIGAFHFALMSDDVTGPVNAVSPHPVTNREFGRVLAKVLGRPYLLTAPTPVLRLMFGEMTDAVLLASTRVLPRRLTASGFAFDHPDLEPALRFLLGR
ncbi:MAG: TIGR01777 family oxidoreductase, partial [Fimbriiglobus sp.]